MSKFLKKAVEDMKQGTVQRETIRASVSDATRIASCVKPAQASERHTDVQIMNRRREKHERD